MTQIININNDNKHLFPEEKDVDYNKLQITDEGLYSITHPKYSELITKYIKESLCNKKKNGRISYNRCNIKCWW